MKRCLALLMSFLMLLALSEPCSHVEAKGNDLILKGKSTSTELFKRVYCDEGTVVAGPEVTDTFGDVTLAINNMKYDGEFFTADFLLNDGARLYEFAETGTLGRGYKEFLSDSRSVVWDCEADRLGPEVLLFELTYGNFINKNRYADQKETEKTALRIYVLFENTLYMFEQSIPDELAWIEALDLEQNGNASRDTSWTVAFVKPVEVFDYTVEEMLGFNPNAERQDPLRTGKVFWTADVPVRVETVVAGDTFYYLSLPIGFYTVNNVTSGDTTWTAEFYISEKVYMNDLYGNPVPVSNLIHYRNVDLRMLCGNATQFLRAGLGGRIARSNTHYLTNLLLSILSTTSNWWQIGQSALNCIQSLTLSGHSVNLNSGGPVTILPSGTTGIGVVSPSGYYLNNNGYSGTYGVLSLTSNSHYMAYQGIATTTLNSGGPVNASAMTRIGWEYYWDGFAGTTKNKTFTTSYTSTHS